VPTSICVSYLNRTESHFRPIQDFVFYNTGYHDPGQRPSALWLTTSPATDAVTTARSPPSNVNTESPHFIGHFRSNVWVEPTSC
jgi:hypothetical protein